MPAAQSLAFVCPRFAEGGTVGGAETLLRNLAVHAAARGRRVVFLTTCARNHFTWENELPAGFRDIDGLRVGFFPVDSDRDVDAFLRVQQAISRKRPVVRDEENLWLRNSVNSRALCDHLRAHAGEFDRVLVGPYLFGLSYAAAGVLPGKTLLVPCLHDEPFAYLESFRELFPSLRGILFNTVPERELGCRLYALDRERTRVVGMGLEAFDAKAERFRRLRGLDGPYIIYCGRREPLKGTPLLLDYLAAFRARTGQDVKLVLTGSGPFDAPADLLPHIIDLGFVPEQDKHDAMSGAAAFCHPSVNESLGIVLLEAWLAGTPALVHGGSAVLKHQCLAANGGLWFHTYPEFEEGLCLLLDDALTRQTLGRQGRAYVEREYAWPRIEEKLLEALDRL